MHSLDLSVMPGGLESAQPGKINQDWCPEKVATALLLTDSILASSEFLLPSGCWGGTALLTWNPRAHAPLTLTDSSSRRCGDKAEFGH